MKNKIIIFIVVQIITLLISTSVIICMDRRYMGQNKQGDNFKDSR